MSNWQHYGQWVNEFEPYEIISYINDYFDYDHEMGRLRWTQNRRIWERLPASMKRKIQQGKIAGSNPVNRDYQIKIDGTVYGALRFVWEHQTGIDIHRIMTIVPHDSLFKIDNLCVIPKGKLRAPKNRAQNLTVVSWSYERKQFTVVKVDKDYNKRVLSYHTNIDSAFEALNENVVSFL